MPLLTRLYSPDAFGVMSVFTSIITVLTVISCLRYEYAIMLPESNEEAGNLLIGSILISILVALLTIPVIRFWGPALTQLLNVPELNPYLWLIPPAIFLGGISVGHPALNYWTTRGKHFEWLAISQVLGEIATTGYQLIAGLVGLGTGENLILGNVAGGSVVSTIMLAVKIVKADGKQLVGSFKWRNMLQSFKRHYKFPLFDTWAALVNTLSLQIPTFFLATYFNASVTGYYALGNGLLRLPMNMIGLSISQVFYQRATEAKSKGTLASVVEKTYSYLVKIGMFPLLIMTIIGKDLFMIVLGPQWSEAGVYTQILSVFTFFVFISSPLSNIFRLLEKQEYSLLINILIITTRIISLIVGGLLKSARIGLLFYSSSGILVFGYLSISTMRISGVPLKRIFGILFNNFLYFLLPGGLLLALSILGLNSWLLISLAILILFVYFFFVIKKDPGILSFIMRIFPFLKLKRGSYPE